MIYNNISLKKLNTFGLSYSAKCLITVRTESEAIVLLRDKKQLEQPLLILGSGSNLLFTEDFDATILMPEMKGIKVEKLDRTGGYVTISAGSGVVWDDLVDWSVKNGFEGFENLSLIPGKVGATPIQNIGAYGVEIKDMIVSVRSIRISDATLRIFTNDECEFDYRDSVFKHREKGKYLVTRVYYRLNLNPAFNLSYGSLKNELTKFDAVNLENIRQAVIDIRQSKLPDPALIGNAGSFFKNPVAIITFAEALQKIFPGMPVFPDRDRFVKIAAGWLIEQCGWKGFREGDAGVHKDQALVLVNHGKASGREIYNLSEKIKESVLNKFGINLEREAEVVGSI